MIKTILLLHSNHYFIKGLEDLLIQWFTGQDLKVSITKNVDVSDKADIIFMTACYTSPKWWRHIQRARRHPLLFLLVDKRNILCCGYEDGQLALSDKPETLYALLTVCLAKKRLSLPSPPSRRYSILTRLSPREREVLWGFKQGLNNHQISSQSGISLKAISAYKKNAMQKLLLKNHADLNYWLQSVAAENLSGYCKRDVKAQAKQNEAG